MMKCFSLKQERCLQIGSILFATISVLGYYLLYRFGFIGNIPCSFLEKTHLYCPGCGGTRAVLFLLKGDVFKSFYYHPIVMYFVVLYGMNIGTTLLQKVWKRVLVLRLRPIYYYISIAIVLIQWVMKNYLLIVHHVSLI